MPATTRKTTVGLWIAQAVLAALFLFAGGFKLLAPAAALTMPVPLPIAFLRFIAVCEILGALGLILPGALRIRRELTPIAAIGLVIIMSGAVTITLETLGVALAILPMVAGLLAGTVAYGRREWLHLRAVAAERIDG